MSFQKTFRLAGPILKVTLMQRSCDGLVSTNPTDGPQSVRPQWSSLLALEGFIFKGMIAFLAIISCNSLVIAQETEGQKQELVKADSKDENSKALGSTITVASPVNDVVFGQIKNRALSLQNEAVKQEKKAYLILEIPPGSSPFHEIAGLTKFLTSSKIQDVTTIAWIPETVTGNNAVLALACNEIVMHPDAELGDLSKGQPLDEDEKQTILKLAQNRHNSKLSTALVQGLMDDQAVVLKVELEQPEGGTESRIVSPLELRRLQDSGVSVTNVSTIKETGQTGILSGSRARDLDVLVVQTANHRSELIDLYNLPREALREKATLGEETEVAYIKVTGVIEPILQTFILRQIDRAISQGKNLIIFDINSPGGYLSTSIELADRLVELEELGIKTVAYVPKQALSGATMVSLGCDEIYLKPTAQFGDVGPIELDEGGGFKHAPEKILGPLRTKMSELALKKGRPTALAEAMSDRTLAVYEVINKQTGQLWYMTEKEYKSRSDEWNLGPKVKESGDENATNLLTVNGTRAHELKIAEPPVQDVEELKERLGIPEETVLRPMERNWMDSMIFLLNTDMARVMLIALGIIFLYVEVHFVTGLFGIMSVVCFATFFWSQFLGGTATVLEIVLFLVGFGLLMVEIFVIPGFGVFGISGILLIFGSLVMASLTLSEIAWWSSPRDLSEISNKILYVGISIGIMILFAVAFNQLLPRIPIMNKIVLTPPALDDGIHQLENEPHLRPDLITSPDQGSIYVGLEGKTLSDLRPAGKIKQGNQILDVVSSGGFVEKGTPVRIIEVTGNHIVVHPIDSRENEGTKLS